MSEEPSTPPASPDAFRRRQPESLLPPRNVPSTTMALALIGSASTAALGIADLLTRALIVAGFGVLAWAVGYFTPPPRRRFRRSDDR